MFKYCPFCGATISSLNSNSFKCLSCGKNYFYNSKPTVGIIPIFGHEALMSIRAIEPDKGYLDVIGGFLDNGEDPIKGAIREFKEETGGDINADDLSFLGVVMSQYLYENTTYQILNILYKFDLKEKTSLKPQDDVAELVWVSLTGNKTGFKINPFTKEVFKLLSGVSEN